MNVPTSAVVAVAVTVVDNFIVEKLRFFAPPPPFADMACIGPENNQCEIDISWQHKEQNSPPPYRKELQSSTRILLWHFLSMGVFDMQAGGLTWESTNAKLVIILPQKLNLAQAIFHNALQPQVVRTKIKTGVTIIVNFSKDSSWTWIGSFCTAVICTIVLTVGRKFGK